MEGRFLEAVIFATRAHKDQKRKNAAGDPYITHPLEVAYAIERAYNTCKEQPSIDVLIAAILHDVVEDTQATPKELPMMFGNVVGGIVAQVTDDKSLSKLERKQIALRDAPRLTPEAVLVKMADKWHNCKDLKEDPPKTWSEEDVLHYAHWSMAMCQAMYAQNINNKVVMALWQDCVLPMFKHVHGITQPNFDVIETYFDTLQGKK